MNYLDIFDRSDIDRHLSNWVPVDERSGVNGEVRHINPAHVTNLAPPPEDPKPKKLAEARPIVYKEKAKPKAPKVISAESLLLFTHCPD